MNNGSQPSLLKIQFRITIYALIVFGFYIIHESFLFAACIVALCIPFDLIITNKLKIPNKYARLASGFLFLSMIVGLAISANEFSVSKFIFSSLLIFGILISWIALVVLLSKIFKLVKDKARKN